MISKKATTSVFSQSVVLAILVSTLGYTSHGSLHASELTLTSPVGSAVESSVFKFLSKDYTLADSLYLMDPSLYDVCILESPSADSGEQPVFQYLLDRTTLFKVNNSFSWGNVNCQTPFQDSSDGVAWIDPLALHIENKSHGLAFCFKKEQDGSVDSNKFKGVAFWGMQPGQKLTFHDLRSVQSGAAIYSDSDVIFENIRGVLSFSHCDSAANGGALAAEGLVIKKCQNVVFSECSTQVSCTSSGALDLFSLGGGACYTCDKQEKVADACIPSGSVSLMENSGLLTIERNTAMEANGGAFACSSFLCKGNSGAICIKANQALSGGAIASQGDVAFLGNTGIIEFIENRSHISPAECHLGGGALAASGTISFKNNWEMQCVKNSSATYGGAFLSKEFFFSENAGSTLWKGNKAGLLGGAVKAETVLSIAENFGSVSFEGNSAQFGGGALYCAQDKAADACVSICGNSGGISFLRNEASCDTAEGKKFVGGGAVYGENVFLERNSGKTLFSNNVVKCVEGSGQFVGGGAVLAQDLLVIADNAGSITFLENGKNTPPEKENLDQVATLSVHNWGGGAALARSIRLCNNSGDLVFSGNITSSRSVSTPNLLSLGGGALLGIDRVEVKKNRAVSFMNNFAMGENASGGAILSTGSLHFDGNGELNFSRNVAQFLGGAVCSISGGVHLVNHRSPVVFSGNKTNAAGGALASAFGTVCIAGNEGDVEFKDNVASGDYREENAKEGTQDITGHHSGGGAVYSSGSVYITGNKGTVLFLGNSTGCFGGAIVTGSLAAESVSETFGEKVHDTEASVIVAENKGDVIFSGNVAFASESGDSHVFGGGAVYTKHLIVSGNEGRVLFYNNSAQQGGAVKIMDGGSVLLSATGGDIVFQGNRNREGGSDGIYLSGKTSKVTELSAAQSRSILFQDALIFEDLAPRGESTDTHAFLVINRDNGDQQVQNTGTVRFASAITKVPQVVHIQQGTLALSDGAQLWVNGLKQDPQSKILLSAETILRIFSSEEELTQEPISPVVSTLTACRKLPPAPQAAIVNENPYPVIDLSSISIDLTSFVPGEEGTLPTPPKVIVPNGLSLGASSLNVILEDSDGCGYENHRLLGTEQEVPLISFQSASGSAVEESAMRSLLEEISVKVATPTIAEDTYGHLGVWSDAKIMNGKLVVGWTPTGYKLNPEKHGSLALNTLWAQRDVLRAVKQQQVSHNITSQRMEFDFSTNVWAAGIGNFTDCGSVRSVDGFIHRAGGYSVGMDTQLVEDLLIGGSFSQFFGYVDSQQYTARCHQHGLLGSAYTGLVAGSFLYKGTFIYSEISHDLVSDYKVLGKSKGSWTSKGILADASLEYRYLLNPKKAFSSLVSAIVPSFGCEYVSIDHPGFTELGNEARTFGKGSLQNVTLPVGVTIEHSYAKGQRSEVNSIGISYAFDVYRHLPEVAVELPQAAYNWVASPVALSRQVVMATFNNNTEWNAYFSTYLGAWYGWREHVASYDINGGIRLIF